MHAAPRSDSPSHIARPRGARLQWMDFVRGICIILVISLHATSALQMFSGIDPAPVIDRINTFFSPFRMTTLMFLSGMLLSRSLSKSTGKYITGKLDLIYWPFLVWSMIVLAAELRLTPEFILKTPVSAPTLLWYLWFIFAYYLLALVIKRLSLPPLLIAAICLAISPFMPEFLRISRFTYLFAFFLLGHHVQASGMLQRLKIPAPAGIAALAVALGGAVLAVSGTPVHYQAVYAWIPLAMITFILWWSPFYTPEGLAAPVARSLEWTGRNSIVFYVAHFPTQCVMARLIQPYLGDNYPASYGVMIASGILAGVGITLLRDRFSVFAALFDFSVVRGWFARRQRA